MLAITHTIGSKDDKIKLSFFFTNSYIIKCVHEKRGNETFYIIFDSFQICIHTSFVQDIIVACMASFATFLTLCGIICDFRF